MAYDGREGRRRIWASTHSLLWGTFLRSSDDFGKTWTNPQEANVRFPADTGDSLKNIWHICLGRPSSLTCSIVASSPPRFSNPAMQERPGRWCAGC